jgi:hypothetical protein
MKKPSPGEKMKHTVSLFLSATEDLQRKLKGDDFRKAVLFNAMVLMGIGGLLKMGLCKDGLRGFCEDAIEKDGNIAECPMIFSEDMAEARAICTPDEPS